MGRKKTGIWCKCEECGKIIYKPKKEYERVNHHFCSLTCSKVFIYKSTHEIRLCEYCGKPFECEKKSTQRFCSNSCVNKWQKECGISRGKNSPNFNSVEKVCETCGKKIYVSKKRLEKSKHFFCSMDCRKYAKGLQSEESIEKTKIRNAIMLSTGVLAKTPSSIQVKVNKILDELNIKYINEYNIKYYAVDNYLPEYNLIIEVMGDFWHCSLLEYKTVKYDNQRKTVARDKSKHTYINRYYNIDVLYLWENDINTDENKCKLLIEEYVNSKGKLDNYNSFNYIIKDNKLEISKDIKEPFFEIKSNDVCA